MLARSMLVFGLWCVWSVTSQAATWQGANAGNWLDPLMWQGDVPVGPGELATFVNPTQSTNVRVTLSESIQLGSLHSTASANVLVLGTGQIEFTPGVLGTPLLEQGPTAGSFSVQTTLKLPESTATIHVGNPNGAVNLIGQMIGTGGELVKSGPGVLNLSADNPQWLGTLRISSGNVVAFRPSSLGVAAGATIVEGGTLQLRSASDEKLVMTSGQIVWDDAVAPFLGELEASGGRLVTGTRAALPATYDWNGPIRLQDGGIFAVAASESRSLILNGSISGNGGLAVGSSAPRSSVEFHGVLEHSGDVEFSAGRVDVWSSNSYSGKTRVHGGEIYIHDPLGLGDARVGTTVMDGFLDVDANSAEPISVERGILILRADTSSSSYTGKLSLGDGLLKTVSGIGRGVQEVIQPVQLLGHGRPEISAANSDTLLLSGGITGQGNVTFSGGGKVRVAGPVRLTGNLIVDAGAPIFEGSSLNSFPGSLVVYNSDAQIMTTGQVNAVHLIGGGINVGAGHRLTTAELRWNQGDISGDLTITGDLLKTGYAPGSLSAIGDSFSGDIFVSQGSVTLLDNQAAGNQVGALYITEPSQAAVQVAHNVTVEDDIFLNNARGIWNRGALRALPGRSTVAGTIDLGDEGSIVGFSTSGDAELRLAGDIRGGQLTVQGNRGGTLNIASNQTTFQGPMLIQDATLRLSEQGRLSEVSELTLRTSRLTFDNSAAGNTSGRLGSNTNLISHGSNIELVGMDGVSLAETLPHVHLVTGETSFRFSQATPVDRAVLRLINFQRERGTTAQFDTYSGSPATIEFDVPPPLNDGIIGPWAFTQGTFATYTADGIVSINSSEEDLNLAEPSSNIRMTAGAMLLGDAQLNSLSIMTTETLDLGGNRLVIESGGLHKMIQASSNAIVNGTITGGTDSSGEFVIRADQDLEFRANLIDNGQLPLSLTVAGDRTVRMYGANTYSGKTYINDGALEIGVPEALPQGSHIEINGGLLNFALDARTAISTGTITLRNNGAISQRTDALTRLQANRYELESGLVAVPLGGPGAIFKSTSGVVRVLTATAQFSGELIVDEGILLLEAPALSTGLNRVDSGGELSLATSMYGNIELAGGILSPARRPAVLTGNVRVTADSLIQLVDISEANYFRSERLSIGGDITVASNQRLTVNGMLDPLTVSGAVRLEPGAVLGGNGIINGRVIFGAGARVEPGNSVGNLTFTTVQWEPGGEYRWEINDAKGLPGAPAGVGWDLLTVNSVNLLATSGEPFVIAIAPLGTSDESTGIANFNPHARYAWPIVMSQSLAGFSSEAVRLDVSNFLTANPAANPLGFAISIDDQQLLLTYSPLTIPGDFNADGTVDATDIDLLVAQLGGTDESFDLTNDGQVDQGDADWMVLDILQTSYGDANLDRAVDEQDLAVWHAHLFQGETNWSHGDFSGDGMTDVSDFHLWLNNRTASAADAIVPEPHSLLIGLSALGLVMCIGRTCMRE